MAPQLQINQGPQDALLYDNSRSYFTNVGYVRTSNFQVEYKTVEPQNEPNWGGTFSFVIPKAADLLGPVDLQMELECTDSGFSGLGDDTASSGDSSMHLGTRAWSEYVDEVGLAMIEKVTFSVGSNDIESITGEQLHLMNELMTSDEMRLGYKTILKTGKSSFSDQHTYKPVTIENASGSARGLGESAPVSKAAELGKNVWDGSGTSESDYKLTPNTGAAHSRVISYVQSADNGNSGKGFITANKKLTVPLGLFFTKHVSQYFPLAAVAGCNDVRITIKLKQINALVKMQGYVGPRAATNSLSWKMPTISKPKECKLMCHYVHVTGPEAQLLMNKEHVRLLKLFQHHHTMFKSSEREWSINLSFLHPVSTLIVTIRRAEDVDNTSGDPITGDMTVSSGSSGAIAFKEAGWATSGKGYFFYHGDGQHPNYDAARIVPGTSPNGATTGDIGTVSSERELGTVKVNSISLSLNGQDRHPGLSKGIDMDYLNSRLLPMLHSNSNQYQKQLLGTGGAGDTNQMQYGLQGSKNIIVFPFSLNPEGSNPSGAVNFSKVSHATLKLHMEALKDTGMLKNAAHGNSGGTDPSDFRVDVYALHYNWLQIKDGRALLSFA